MVKARSAGRFGVRYGLHVKRRIADVEEKQHKRQLCIFCNGRAKRSSKGIWSCLKCGKTFAGHAYYLEQKSEEERDEREEKFKPKNLKK